MDRRTCRQCGAEVIQAKDTETGITHQLDRTDSAEGLVFTFDRRGNLYAPVVVSEGIKPQLYRLHTNHNGDQMSRFSVPAVKEEYVQDPNQKKPTDFIGSLLLITVTQRKEVKNNFKTGVDSPDTKPMVVCDVVALDGQFAGETHKGIGFMGVVLVEDLPQVGDEPMLARLNKKAMGSGSGYILEHPNAADIQRAESFMDAQEKGGAKAEEKPPWE